MKKGILKVNKVSEDLLADKIAGLKRVIPEVFSEDKIDWEKLKLTLDGEIDNRSEKYGLSWAGKSEAFRAIRIPATGTLVPQEKESKDLDKTQNIFIEGDNLEALKLLQKHYREQIKMIYIDPPYNTGKDFIYKDNFTEGLSDYYERTGQAKDGVKMTSNLESNGRYHSNWLTMMYPRLFMAHNLLREDGVIFISIDDNEVHNLRMIMDEIFGEENFIGQMIVRSNPRGSQEPFGISVEHEYLLSYGKTEESKLNIVGFERPDDDSEFSFIDSEGKKARLLGLRKRGGDWRRTDRPNMFYPFYIDPKTCKVSLKKTGNCNTKVLPIRPEGEESRWTWGKDTAEKQIDLLVAKEIKRNNKTVYDVYRIDYLENDQGEKKTEKLKSILEDKELNYQFARQYFKEYFGNSEIFDFPKSPVLISKLIASLKGKDGIVLDFFAGSGTTAHAVMSLNAEDGGNRKWICVQIPEEVDEKSEAKKAGFNTIAEIARERIRRAAVKIGEKIHPNPPLPKEGIKSLPTSLCERKENYNFPPLQKPVPNSVREGIKGGLDFDLDLGFKSFKLSKSNYRQWNVITDKDDEKKLKAQMKLFVEKPLVDNYDEKSVVYEILTKEGFDLNAKVSHSVIPAKAGIQKLEIWTITDSECRAVITFAKKLIKEQVDFLGLSENDTFVCLDSALDDTTKVNLMRNYNIKVI